MDGWMDERKRVKLKENRKERKSERKKERKLCTHLKTHIDTKTVPSHLIDTEQIDAKQYSTDNYSTYLDLLHSTGLTYTIQEP